MLNCVVWPGEWTPYLASLGLVKQLFLCVISRMLMKMAHTSGLSSVRGPSPVMKADSGSLSSRTFLHYLDPQVTALLIKVTGV